MKLISHRGNINGVYEDLENTKTYIQQAIDIGYDVEIDVWYNDGFWLGHDEPQYPVELEWLINRKDALYIHCKNFQALTNLIDNNLNLFFHEREEYTIMSNNLIWAHNITNVDARCIIPLLSKKDVENWTPTEVYGVCSDYIDLIKEK